MPSWTQRAQNLDTCSAAEATTLSLAARTLTSSSVKSGDDEVRTRGGDDTALGRPHNAGDVCYLPFAVVTDCEFLRYA
ncbi:MAG: hypothetical protein ABI586_04645 [Candidatus Nanopelagicales bacterium]